MVIILFLELQTKLEKLNLSSQINFDASDDEDIDICPIETLSSPDNDKGPTIASRMNDDNHLRSEENATNGVVRNGRPPLVSGIVQFILFNYKKYVNQESFTHNKYFYP